MASSNADWMGKVCDQPSGHPLTNLCIPGSHNSFTNSLERRYPVGDDVSELVRWLGRHLPICFKPIIMRWSRCQRWNVNDQLESGIRYFDIRLGRIDDDLRILHALHGDKIEPILQDVNDFLEKHLREIVILDFQHVYSFKSSHHKYLVELIRKTFKGKLCPIMEDTSKLTIESMVKKSQRVIVVYPSMAKTKKFLWPRHLCPNPWPDTEDLDQLIEYLTDDLKSRDPSNLLVSQAVLTPSMYTVVKGCARSLEKTLARKCDARLREWLISKDRPANLNIVMADFVNTDGLLELIISLNF